MKVLQLAQTYPPSVGGMQSLLSNVCGRLVHNHGHDVEVWTTDAFDNPASPTTRRIAEKRGRLDGVDIERFGYVTAHRRAARVLARACIRYEVPGASTLNLARRGPIAPRLAGRVLTADVDVIAASSFDYLHMYYPYVARTFRRRFGLVYTGLLHLTSTAIDDRVLRAISSADFYIALTTFERDALVRSGVTTAELVVVPPGVDLARFQGGNAARIRSRLGLDDEPIIAYVGRQARYKGVQMLVDAMPDVWSSSPESRLVIAGATTSFSPELRAVVSRLPPSQQARISILDDIDEPTKEDLLAAADIFASISSEESFGISYLEAWAANTPVIGADVGAVRSVIGEDGLLVDVDDVQGLSRAITRLLGDRSLRIQLARAGYERARTEHDWDTLTARIDAVYREAAARGA